MSDSKAEQRLIRIYHDEDNFILKLVTQRNFDEGSYQEIIQLYSNYISGIDEETSVNRQVARFLLDIMTLLEGALNQFRQNNHPLTQRVGNAHAETMDLLHKLLC